MELAVIDVVIFSVFIITVISVGILKSRHEKDSEAYFLAGRGLGWCLIGFSLIAANISAEQFVGMSGQAAKDSIGLAVASYEWIAAVTLVVVAFLFLPKFLRSGIFTIPEYLEYRFNHIARTIMSLFMVAIYVGVTIATVIFLGAKAADPLFTGKVYGIPLDITTLSWIIGIVAAIYVAAGGLKACAWADLIQGTALILGGAVIMILAFMALDNPGDFEGIDAAAVHKSIGVDEDASFAEKFQALKEKKMHMRLPRGNTFLPWTALLLGIWIPNFYYWGLNQYIMQRTLGARSLTQGQKGIVFAAWLKLIIPFIVCIPGIIAFTLYAEKMQEDAMTKELLNAPVLEEFKSARGDPASAKKVFPFDGDFAELHSDLAKDVLVFNAAVLGVQLSAEDDLAEMREKLVPVLVEKDAGFKKKLEEIVQFNERRRKKLEKLISVLEEKEDGFKKRLEQMGQFDEKRLKKLVPILVQEDPGFKKELEEMQQYMEKKELGITDLNAEAVAVATASYRPVWRRILDWFSGEAAEIEEQKQLVGYDYDGAFPLLMRYLTPEGTRGFGLRGFVLAALMGAVISSLASMLNAASTIFTMDIYREYIKKDASQISLVWVGRCCVVVFVLIGCWIAPKLANPKFEGAFAYIQEFQGYVSPGVLTIFLFGLFVPRSPRSCGVVGLVLSPIVYGLLHLFWGDLAFLNRMAITVGVLTAVLAVITLAAPLKEKITLPVQAEFDMTSSRGAKLFGLLAVVATAVLYFLFW